MKSTERSLRELFRITVRNVGLLEKDDASCCGVTTSQCHALVEIGRSGTISLIDLAQQLNLDKSTLSRTINNLVESDLLIREQDPDNRRYIKIQLTKKGLQLYQNIEDSMDDYFQKIIEEIPAEKLPQVRESIDLLLESVGSVKCCEKEEVR